MGFIFAYTGVASIADVAVECTEGFFCGLCFRSRVCGGSHLRQRLEGFVDEAKGSAHLCCR
jgi:hypothetical protein